MIVYSATRAEFTRDVFSNQIEEVVLESFKRELGRFTGLREIASLKTAMRYMDSVLAAGEILEDGGLASQYEVTFTSKPLGTVITGADEVQQNEALIVELKQRQSGRLTIKQGAVETHVVDVFLPANFKGRVHDT